MNSKERGLELLESLAVIPWLNMGGCLYSAYGVFLVLKREALLSDDVVLVQFAGGIFGTPTTTNKKFIQGSDVEATSSSHFGISFDGGETAYDSEGEINEEAYSDRLVISTEYFERLSLSALKHGGWNDTFDRKYDLREVNKILGTEMPSDSVYNYIW